MTSSCAYLKSNLLAPKIIILWLAPNKRHHLAHNQYVHCAVRLHLAVSHLKRSSIIWQIPRLQIDDVIYEQPLVLFVCNAVWNGLL